VCAARTICGYASPGGAPAIDRAQRAVVAARAAGDPILESSALDSLTSAHLFRLDIVAAHNAATERLARLRSGRGDDPGASRGTGFGELFEAMVLLRRDRPRDAFDVLTAPGDRGLYGAVFPQWTTALTDEAAARSGRNDARRWIAQATAASTGNPAAAAIVERARRA
jgi:hypothetical protein